jgi:hypothetical protein
MRIEARWVCKPSITLAIILLFLALAHLTPCSATESQNKTLTEVSSYNFPAGYYQVVKYAENSAADYWIMSESKLPYLNITYTAPSHGILSITLKPTEGYVPYIEFNEGWDTDGLTYTNPMLFNETSYLLLTPPLRFTDSNFSRITGGSITLWEMYKWGNTSGQITYSFTSPDDITFELLMHPINPVQSSPIDFFTTSNSDIKHIRWDFPELNWINESDIIEINGLDAGKYNIYVRGEDIFNSTHQAQIEFIVSPPPLNPQSFDLDFFSISCPETVSQGEQVTISATIDYSMPTAADIKCQLYDPIENAVCKELVYSVSDSGSKQFDHQFIADEEGLEPLIMKLYYNVGGGWVEVIDAERTMMITVNVANASTSIPGFNLISIISGLLLLTILSRNQNND